MKKKMKKMCWQKLFFVCVKICIFFYMVFGENKVSGKNMVLGENMVFVENMVFSEYIGSWWKHGFLW